MSDAAYIPGAMARRFAALPPPERKRVAAQTDRIFRERTGLDRKLRANGDRLLRRRWLRIRDEVMLRRYGDAAPRPHLPGSMLSGSVGEGGQNRPQDVESVALMLNSLPWSEDIQSADAQAMAAAAPDNPIMVETLFGSGVTAIMIEQIANFQERILRQAATGLIEPDSHSARMLMRFYLDQGELIPILNPQGWIDPKSVYRVQGGAPDRNGLVFKSGQIIKSFDGRRMILSINQNTCVFALLDKHRHHDAITDFRLMARRPGLLYAQKTTAFVDDYTLWLLQKLDRDLAPVATILETEVMILAGIFAGFSGTAIYLTGFKVSDFLLKNGRKIPHWVAMAVAYFLARMVIARYCPKLNEAMDKVFIERFVGNVGAKEVALFIGKLIAMYGEVWVKQRFSLIGELIKVLLGIVLQTLTVLGDTLVEGADDAKRLAAAVDHLGLEFRTLGIVLSEHDLATILRQIERNPKPVLDALKSLKATFDKHLPLA